MIQSRASSSLHPRQKALDVRTIGVCQRLTEYACSLHALWPMQTGLGPDRNNNLLFHISSQPDSSHTNALYSPLNHSFKFGVAMFWQLSTRVLSGNQEHAFSDFPVRLGPS